MTERFPILSNIKQTLQRWKIELNRTQDFEGKLEDAFTFKNWEPGVNVSPRLWTQTRSMAKYCHVGDFVFIDFILDGTISGGTVATVAVKLPILPEIISAVNFDMPEFIGQGFTGGAPINTDGYLDEDTIVIADNGGGVFSGATTVGFKGFYRVGVEGKTLLRYGY